MALFHLRGRVVFEVDTLVTADTEEQALKIAEKRAVVSVFDSDRNPSSLRTWVSGNPSSGDKVGDIVITSSF